ncbi:MAG: 30S ribosomal protein S4 [Patescibacteria group bacterium]|nr:30S ribosomal protein S4 [Patescibacteria group bacterium]
MSQYIGPKCRLCRREGVKLFLKGEKCDGPKCPIVVRQSAPGPHKARRRKVSEYGLQLREKQKVKRIYLVSEAQIKNYFESSRKTLSSAGTLLSRLERRLDNAVYRLGLAASRPQARQRIRHGHFKVSGRLVTYPAYELKSGDTITFVKESTAERIVPAWLSLDLKKKEARVLALPSRDQIQEDIDEKSIVEFYSR